MRNRVSVPHSLQRIAALSLIEDDSSDVHAHACDLFWDLRLPPVSLRFLGCIYSAPPGGFKTLIGGGPISGVGPGGKP